MEEVEQSHSGIMEELEDEVLRSVFQMEEVLEVYIQVHAPFSCVVSYSIALIIPFDNFHTKRAFRLYDFAYGSLMQFYPQNNFHNVRKQIF